ncbi:MAG: hypothetical protein JNM90_25420 [Burkholderiales bacterium]|nr:hypothetical protein [Burkholderiales bacterium]
MSLPPPANPYAAPAADLEAAGDDAGGMWRDGKDLVMAREARLPGRCVRCNGAARARHAVTLSWLPPAWYAAYLPVLLVAVEPGAIIALVVAPMVLALARRRAQVELALCARHHRRVELAARLHRWGLALLVPLFVYAFASIGEGIPHAWRLAPPWAMASFALAIPWGIAIGLLRRLASARRIDAAALRIRGCGEAFLASLPPPPAHRG